jgi:hypothetical protein
MTDQITSIRNELETLVEGMKAKGIKMPSSTFSVESDKDPVAVTVRYAGPNENYPSTYKFFPAENPLAAFVLAQEWLSSQPTAKERLTNAAIELTAKALEAAREANLLEGDEESSLFLAQLESLMKKLSSNIITDQSSDDIPF